MRRFAGALVVALVAGCGSQEKEPLRLAKLIAAEVPAAREAWQEAGQPNLLLRPRWPKKLFMAVAENPEVREVLVGVRYVDDRYVWTGFAASLYRERRIDYPQVAGDGPGKTSYRTYDARARGYDAYALLDPDGGPYADPIEVVEPGIWSWERRDGVAVRVDAADGTPVILFYDSPALEEKTKLPAGAGSSASSAVSGAGLESVLEGLKSFRHAEAMLPEADLAQRRRWKDDEAGLGHEELRAELAHLTKDSPKSLLALKVSRIGVEGEFVISQGRPVGIFLGTWLREGVEPLPRAGRLLYRGRAGDWILTALKGDGRRWVEASTWISWKDVPIRVDAYVDLGK